MGHSNWLVVERSACVGGHAASVVDPAGFTWDLGGHVVFSHFGEFDALLDEVMGDDVNEHERSSFIRLGDRWIPYPFQNNLRYLGRELADICLAGLRDAPGGDPDMDFATWIEATFGPGITTHFMRPYNEKVWATPLDGMSAKWIADRISVVDFRRARENVVEGRDDVGWGPNNMFKFPRSGGTGEIYRRLAARFPDRIAFGRELEEVDVAAKTARFSDGAVEEFDALVSTIPLDRLVTAVRSCPSDVRAAATALEHNGFVMVGVGYEAPLEDDRSWMYFPEGRTPFYRATNFAKYARANVPGGDADRYCSYLTETSYSAHSARPGNELQRLVPEALEANGLVRTGTPIASIHTVDLEYAYPIPTRDLDATLAAIQPWLMNHDVYSRGRFGSWRYEMGNMDHAVKMGIDVARLLVEARPEELWQP
jgi:protoporphyrinogen oxidase